MDETELVEQILQGDTKLYAEIVKRYSGQVFSKMLCMTKNTEEAQELTQQTFVRAYTRLECWRGGALGGWISAIAMHLSLDAIAKAKRLRSTPIDNIGSKEQDDPYNEERERKLLQMEAAMATLSENDQAIIKLHYYEGKKANDIAGKLGMTQSNVLVKLHRIREQLKKKMEDERA